jgi:site-specific recombinase XerD
MLGNGASLKDIADVLRHRSINTTMIYYRPKVVMCSLGSGSLIAK